LLNVILLNVILLSGILLNDILLIVCSVLHIFFILALQNAILSSVNRVNVWAPKRVKLI
jgi:hypothetical protein